MVEFGSGSRLWLAVISAPQAAGGASRAVSSAAQSGSVPELYRAGVMRPYDAVVYLAAVLGAARLAGVGDVAAFPEHQHPGLGALIKDGSRILLPVVHTARSGQGPGRPYHLQQTF